MGSKVFRVATATEAVEFTIEYLEGGKPRRKTFHCRPAIPVGAILKFGALAGGGKDDTASGADVMEMVQDIFRTAIVTEEQEEWRRITNDPDISLDVNLYSEIAGWLAGEYTARPTGESSSTSSQDQSSGHASTVGASPVVLSYSKVEPVTLAH